MQLPTTNPITQPFGYDPNYPLNNGNHIGVDFAYTPNEIAYAPEDATITFYGNAGTCGNNLQFTGATGKHGFCHLARSLVSVGDKVTKGQPLAVIGDTGAAIGKHLHWVLRINGEYVDPMAFVEDIDMEEINKLYTQLDQTNKNVSQLYTMVDQINKNVDQLYNMVDAINKSLANGKTEQLVMNQKVDAIAADTSFLTKVMDSIKSAFNK